MRVILIFSLLLRAVLSNGQMTVTGKVLPGDTLIFNIPFDCWYYDQFSHNVVADTNGIFSIRLPVSKPQTIFLDWQKVRLYLYAEPGSTLHLQQDDSLRFSGSLGKENEFRRKTGLTFYLLGEKTWNDTLSDPEDIRKALGTNQEKTLSALRSQASDFSKDFVSMTRADIRYFALSKIRDLMWSTAVLLTHGNKSKFDLNHWKSASNQAYSKIELSDSTAVNSYHYQIAVANFVHHLEEQTQNLEDFKTLAEKILGVPFEEVSKEVRRKGKRYWEHEALNYGFKGVSREYALASFITNGILQGNLEYLTEAYEYFCSRFPDSPYRMHISQVMQPYLKSRQNMKDSTIRFVAESPENLDTILSRFKGKVLYIDLWGSWCGPCRKEFAFNQDLKQNFDSKDVIFIYIAVEHSPDHENKWRETVKFYNLSGYHILADKSLEQDLRKRYNRDGAMSFPSYILVDKTGKIITLNARRPSEKETLYKQINDLL